MITQEEIAIVKIIQKRGLDKGIRDHEYSFKRFYLMGYLFYKLKWTEEEIAYVFNVHHTTVNYGKRIPFTAKENNDVKFLNETASLKRLFPFEFPKNNEYILMLKKNYPNIRVRLTSANKEKLQRLKGEYFSLNTLINHLIESI